MQQLHARKYAVVCRCVSERAAALDTNNVLFACRALVVVLGCIGLCSFVTTK